MRKIAILMSLSILLMSFQCDNDLSPHDNYEFNEFKVNITAKSNFKKNDTIWVEGTISSNVYDKAVRDSTFYDAGFSPAISFYKLIEPKESIINSKDALDKIEIIYDMNKISFLDRCENSTFFPQADLSNDKKFYKYKVGFKLLTEGDYIINFWADSRIINSNLNEHILDEYKLTQLDTKIGFDSCGETSYRAFEDETRNEYFFTVE